jgi:hypothetical protein
VGPEIPQSVADDFREALRCLWVEAYKATVTMCRRAIQTACLDLHAVGRDLFHQIDDLAAKSKITAPLQQMAHAVRLQGKKAAHPLEVEKATQQREASAGEARQDDPANDGLEGTTKEEAEAVIEFTREFFHHIYVMPALLRKYVPLEKEPGGTSS